ncbi:MAG TPA: extracellular solute-binding protein [Puia sp.]|uniref:ABC transporter substrate-binding protein n=1 Tax=Puia sp. TaxID=2045100 RepID=UPI002D120A14|nr:extracellular solute-binding protein [Puia sp.]HVU94466.1 extracellular solute-binding protein [Puia sp.]
MATKIKGITWDHPRGYQPLRAVAAEWGRKAGIQLQWDVRTLKEFGDMPVEVLVDRYDLIIIDHPYMGEAASKALLLPLEDHLPQSFLDVQAAQSVGPSYDSYGWKGRHYALPVDAAAQVAVMRADLADAIGWGPPVYTEQLRAAAEQLPTGKFIAIPLCPTDIWCVFLTLCAQYNGGEFFTPAGIEEPAGRYALAQLQEWATFLHPNSFRMNPIQMLDRMAAEDEIVYCPFSFGYTNYARKDAAGIRLVFMDAPRRSGHGISTLLGGAGIAVSRNSANRNACMDFIRYVLDPEVQRTTYYINGGQPAHLSAWEDPACNADSGDFFGQTLYTLQHAYRRKGAPGFNRFQEAAADIVHVSAMEGMDGALMMRQLNNLFQAICHDQL